MIELEGVTWGGDSDASAGAELSIAGGTAVAIVGSAGAGKTQLAEIAAARRRPPSGRVRIFGREVRRLRASSLARLRRRIGFAPQTPRFFDDESLRDNVGLPLALDGAPRAEVEAAADKALEAVGSAAAATARVRELSQGERRRAAVARALVGAPSLVVIDDPIAGLDLDDATRLISALEGVRAEGAALWVASAEPRFVSAARYLSWELYTLREGALAAPAQARSRPHTGPEHDAENVVPFPAQRAAGEGA